MLQNRAVCEIVLKACKWDLDQAFVVVTKSGRDRGLITHRWTHNQLNNFPHLSTRSPPIFCTARRFRSKTRASLR